MFFETVGKIIAKYGPMFLQGAGTTLLIAITGTLIGFAIGLVIGIVRTIPLDAKSSPVKRILLKVVNTILAVYIEVFRGTPMIVQAMVLFYGFAAATGISPDTTIAGIVIVSINTGAYMAEIVRGGILSIDKGQFEAAHSIGMTHGQTMTSIILPQAIRNILPATGNEFVINIKDTSVLNVISVTELFFKTSMVNAGTYKPFETFFVACVLYFIMTFTVTRILRLIERKMDGPKTFTIHGSQTVPEAEIKVTDGEKTTWIK
ncbi:MAG: amino acid ABC transporter permease [Christensenellaceae bacterium]|nr:amino acid ABC transporter permease [Christensenellaceae bacterium]